MSTIEQDTPLVDTGRNLPDLSHATTLERLQANPVIDRIEPRVLALIGKQVAPECTHAEIGHFLELCAHYDLDPFAKEVWIAKDKSGRLLIMVGRDGLRKVAQRNGLHIDGAAVRGEDEYAVDYVRSEIDAQPGEWQANGSAPFHRVTHTTRGMGKQRGEVTGAWCRVTVLRTGRQVGWFEAPIEEYRPSNVSPYSPWSKQVAVMVLAAAERQAIRQATPLSGLLAVGEDETAFENERPPVTFGVGDGTSLGARLPPEVDAIIERAGLLGHAGLSDRPTVELTLTGQTAAHIADWVARATAELDELADVVDAEVVGEHDDDTADELQARIDRMLERAMEADRESAQADAAGDDDAALLHATEAEGLREEALSLQFDLESGAQEKLL